jgi:hypothetical protein
LSLYKLIESCKTKLYLEPEVANWFRNYDFAYNPGLHTVLFPNPYLYVKILDN